MGVVEAGAAGAEEKEGGTLLPSLGLGDRSFPFVFPLAAAAAAAAAVAVVVELPVTAARSPRLLFLVIRTATIHWTIASTAKAKPT